MKNLTLFFVLAFVTITIACNKDNGNNPTPATPTPTSPYYFKFNMNGKDYNLNANFPQYMPFYHYEAGGYQVAAPDLYPSAGIRFSWSYGDTVTEGDLTGLEGKTLYYSDTAMMPELSFATDFDSDDWYSIDTPDNNYNIKINKVTYVKKDTTLGHALKIYLINGTCSGILTDGKDVAEFSNGEFNFLISRQDW